MESSSLIAPKGDAVPPGDSTGDVLRHMLMEKVRATLGDPAQPCSPQAYLLTVIDVMLAGERVRDFMCGEARTLANVEVETRLRKIIDDAFGDSYHRLSEFYRKRVQFTNTLIFMQVLDVHKKLGSGALDEREYDKEIRHTVHFQLGRFGIEFAHTATGRDLARR